MTSALNVDVVAEQRCLQLAVLDSGRRVCRGTFPSSPVGWAVARIFLVGLRKPLRIAVAGTAAVGFALAMGYAGNCLELTIVADGSQLAPGNWPPDLNLALAA